MKRRIAVRAIIVRGGRLHCVRLKPYKGKIAGDYWCVIGGGVEPGEPLIEALKREVVEETGVKPVIGNLLYVQQFRSGGNEQMEFFFHVTNDKDFLNIDLSRTTHGEIEIAKIDFIDVTKETVLPEFLTKEKYENLENHPTKFFNYL